MVRSLRAGSAGPRRPGIDRSRAVPPQGQSSGMRRPCGRHIGASGRVDGSCRRFGRRRGGWQSASGRGAPRWDGAGSRTAGLRHEGVCRISFRQFEPNHSYRRRVNSAPRPAPVPNRGRRRASCHPPDLRIRGGFTHRSPLSLRVQKRSGRSGGGVARQGRVINPWLRFRGANRRSPGLRQKGGGFGEGNLSGP